jgi:hypothetical protein
VDWSHRTQKVPNKKHCVFSVLKSKSEPNKILRLCTYKVQEAHIYGKQTAQVQQILKSDRQLRLQVIIINIYAILDFSKWTITQNVE